MQLQLSEEVPVKLVKLQSRMLVCVDTYEQILCCGLMAMRSSRRSAPSEIVWRHYAGADKQLHLENRTLNARDDAPLCILAHETKSLPILFILSSDNLV